MKDQRDNYCPVCDKEYEEIVLDGIRSHAVCRTEDHVVSHEWHMFHYGGTRPPTFITTQIVFSFADTSAIIEFENDEPLTLNVLNQGINNIVNRYHNIVVKAKDITIDFKDLPRLIKLITENIAFV